MALPFVLLGCFNSTSNQTSDPESSSSTGTSSSSAISSSVSSSSSAGSSSSAISSSSSAINSSSSPSVQKIQVTTDTTGDGRFFFLVDSLRSTGNSSIVNSPIISTILSAVPNNFPSICFGNATITVSDSTYNPTQTMKYHYATGISFALTPAYPSAIYQERDSSILTVTYQTGVSNYCKGPEWQMLYTNTTCNGMGNTMYCSGKAQTDSIALWHRDTLVFTLSVPITYTI